MSSSLTSSWSVRSSANLTPPNQSSPDGLTCCPASNVERFTNARN